MLSYFKGLAAILNVVSTYVHSCALPNQIKRWKPNLSADTDLMTI